MKAEIEKTFSGRYLIWISGTGYAWTYGSKRAAEKFAANLNAAINCGELIESNGQLVRVNV